MSVAATRTNKLLDTLDEVKRTVIHAEQCRDVLIAARKELNDYNALEIVKMIDLVLQSYKVK